MTTTTTRRRGSYVVEEVEFFRRWLTPHEIARTLHMSISAIARALYRAGRQDLAQPFAHLEQQEIRSKTK